MKVSDFIIELKNLEELYGDLPIKFMDYEYNGGIKYPQVYVCKDGCSENLIIVIDEE